MRHFRLIVVSLAMLVVSSSPALAQSSSAAADQYGGHASGASVGDGIKDATEKAAEGTKAVNAALSGTASPEASAPAVDSASNAPDRVAGLTELPETGGVSVLLPSIGVLLVASGLLVRRALHCSGSRDG